MNLKLRVPPVKYSQIKPGQMFTDKWCKKLFFMTPNKGNPMFNFGEEKFYECFEIKTLEMLMEYAEGLKQFHEINGVELPKGTETTIYLTPEEMKVFTFELDKQMSMQTMVNHGGLKTDKITLEVHGIVFNIIRKDEPKKPVVRIEVFVTNGQQFRAKIQEEGKDAFELIVGGSNWIAGNAKPYEKEVLEKCREVVENLSNRLKRIL